MTASPGIPARHEQTPKGSQPSTGQREPATARFLGLQRTLILIATTLIAVNIWTGAPLAALWVGSRVLGGGQLTMTAVFVVVLALAVLLGAMAFALTWLKARYDELTGQPTGERRTLPWLRSIRAEDTDTAKQRRITALERIVIANTVTAVIALEIWFFFFAKNPLPG